MSLVDGLEGSVPDGGIPQQVTAIGSSSPHLPALLDRTIASLVSNQIPYHGLEPTGFAPLRQGRIPEGFQSIALHSYNRLRM